jgi:carbon storage regulator
MLVITRKEGERIVIGGDIVIAVVESKRALVRIEIEAPTRIRVQQNQE